MKAYIELKPHGSAESVELSSVAPSSFAWFPDEAPEPPPLEPPVAEPSPVEDAEFFWQELTEEEISERQGSVGDVGGVSQGKLKKLFLSCSAINDPPNANKCQLTLPRP